MFGGWTRFADRCPTCALDFSRFNVGDGPAAFLTLVLGTIVVILAVAVELTLHPPLWAHLLLWTPLLLVGTVWSLRVAKAALAASEWRNDAREAGRP